MRSMYKKIKKRYSVSSYLLPTLFFLFIITGTSCKKEVHLTDVTPNEGEEMPETKQRVQFFSNLKYGPPMLVVVNGDTVYGGTTAPPSTAFQGDTIRIKIDSTAYDPITYEAIYYPIIDQRADQLKSGNWDVYVVSDLQGGYKLVIVDNKLPAAPANGMFKLRVINLDSDLPGNASLHVTDADGSSVHNDLQQVAYSTTSSYVELPYGNYQFNIVDENERLVENFYHEIHKIYSPYMYYQAGGVYSIFVFSNKNNNPESTVDRDTVYKQDPLAQVQVLNAIPGTTITARLNSNTIASNLPFAVLGAYSIQQPGSANINITVSGSATGSIDTSFQLQPLDNITYYTVLKNNTPSLIAVPNSFGLVSISGRGFEAATRFLNLSPDAGEVNFGLIDGNSNLNFPDTNSAQHISFLQALPFKNGGFTVGPDGMAYASFGEPPYLFSGPPSYPGAPTFYDDLSIPLEIQVYHSIPGSADPGDRIADLSIPYPFVVNKNKYTFNGNYEGPRAEPGLYTVILAGKTNATAPSNEAAKLIIVKHSK